MGGSVLFEIWIPRSGIRIVPQSIISGIAEKKRVRIDDYNATIDHDFPFKKYEEVIFDGDGHKGTVIDAEWVGKDTPATFYTVTYWVKSLTDGSIIELKLSEILAFNRRG